MRTYSWTNIFCFGLSLHVIQASEHSFQEWAADIPGGYADAVDVAKQHKVILLHGHVHRGKHRTPLFRLAAQNVDEKTARDISAYLATDSRIKWVSRQIALSREKKYTISKLEQSEVADKRTLSRRKRHHTEVNCACMNVSNYPKESFGDHAYEVMNRQSDPSLSQMFNDPKWPCQWELYNCGQTLGPHRVDLNVVPCWEKGFTGKGIVISIVDDGLDYANKDLEHSYDERASADLNEYYDDDGPLPNKKRLGNDHGTKCGGEIVMKPNNNYCGVGVAYDASLGGIRFLDGVVTDTSEAAALVFNADYIDIYSCSWGPQDNGESWEGPGKLASAALEIGSDEGRDGLGSVYVWAAGNGGASGDHCGADGYTCSIYTIAIASASDQGLSTFYTESCSCIMAVTLNGGPHHLSEPISQYRPLHYLVTTDPYEGCVNTFSGTSSAAPLASGIIALMLQANQNLTWRDVQHLIAKNSKIPNPTEDGWKINGAGYHVHNKYGFGLLDAAKLVMASQSWKNVGKQQRCEVKFSDARRDIKSGGLAIFRGHTDACSDSVNRVRELEHVQVVMSYGAKCRGDVSIELMSPCGTTSTLMGTRPMDASNEPVKDWPFMTVHSWGEDPRGIWKIKVKDNKGYVKKCQQNIDDSNSGVNIYKIHIVFWGTAEDKSENFGCQTRQHMAKEVAEDDLHSNKKLHRISKDPLAAEESIDQEIVNAEFVKEHAVDVTADNLQDSTNGKMYSSKKKSGKSSHDNIANLRQKLVKFLERNDDHDNSKFFKDRIPLEQSDPKSRIDV